ncbi:MAG: hypothetical protein ACK4PI_02080 [Tepidisphaerales bacterium]
MTPSAFLGLTGGALALALATSAAVRLVRSARVARWARGEGMQFSAIDRFRLAERVALHLPVPGAAAVHVHDVMYRRADGEGRLSAAELRRRRRLPREVELPGGRLMCVMSVGYTVGTVGHRRHHRRVVALLDDGGPELGRFLMLTEGPSREAYRRGLRHLLDGPTAQTPGGTLPLAGAVGERPAMALTAGAERTDVPQDAPAGAVRKGDSDADALTG